MQIYWNKRECYHKKSVELPQDWLGTPISPPCHRFAIWLPYCMSSCAYALCLSLSLFAFWLSKFTTILNLLTKEMKSPDIPTYSFFWQNIFDLERSLYTCVNIQTELRLRRNSIFYGKYQDIYIQHRSHTTNALEGKDRPYPSLALKFNSNLG